MRRIRSKLTDNQRTKRRTKQRTKSDLPRAGPGLRGIDSFFQRHPPEARPRRRPLTPLCSDLEPHVDDIAVANHVFLALEPELARLTHFRIGAQRSEILVAYDLGADKAAGDIAVNTRSRF